MQVPSKLLLALLCVIGMAQATTEPAGSTPWPFAPALYTLRATNHHGSSLILLDAGGKETVVFADRRTSKGNGLVDGRSHATHFGPFSCTPDGSKVLYTLFGQPKNASSGGIGIGLVGFSGSDAFGTRDFEGFFVWDRATGKTKRLWKYSDIEDIGEYYRLRLDVFNPRLLKDDLEINAPTYLFHLKDQRFLWITCSWFLLVDLADSSCKVLDACSKTQGDFRVNAIHAWQEADGTVFAFRDGHRYQISPAGQIQRLRPVEEGWTTQLLAGEHGFIFGNGKRIKIMGRSPAGSLEERAAFDRTHEDLRYLPANHLLLDYQHSRLEHDVIQGIGPKGETLWLAGLGSCEPGLFLSERQGKIQALVRRTSEPKGVHKLVIDSVTGKVESDEVWQPTPISFTRYESFQILGPSTPKNEILCGGQPLKLAYTHAEGGSDTLQGEPAKAKEPWTLNLGPCLPGLRVASQAGKVLVFLSHPDKPSETRILTVDRDTGAALKDEVFQPSEPEDRDLLIPITPEFTQLAYTIPTPAGTLAWMPSTGPAVRDPELEAWKSLRKPSAQTLIPRMGVWLLVDADLRARPLIGRPLADEMLLILNGRPTPLSTWSNHGISCGSGTSGLTLNLLIGASVGSGGGGAAMGTGGVGFGTGSVRGQDVEGSGVEHVLLSGRFTTFPAGRFDRLVPTQLTAFAEAWLTALPIPHNPAGSQPTLLPAPAR